MFQSLPVAGDTFQKPFLMLCWSWLFSYLQVWHSAWVLPNSFCILHQKLSAICILY